MQQYIDAIRQSLDKENWLAALFVALSLPDICGGLETPGQFNGKTRSVRWFDLHMACHYTISIPERSRISVQLPPLKPKNFLHERACQDYTAARKARSRLVRLEMSKPNVQKVLLSGADCYALRCALLHKGSDQMDRQRAQDTLERFVFTIPRGRACFNGNLMMPGILQISVPIFCSQVAVAVDDWAKTVATDMGIQQEMKRLLRINFL